MLTPADLLSTGHPLDVRDGDPRDGIDGIVPQLVIEPRSREGVAATLACAAERRAVVLIQGAGTKREWGRRPNRLDAILSMRQLNRVLVHRHGDLTVTVEAGTSLRALNHALAAHGQQLPLDPPFADRATVGGLLATNDSGPARHRFGTPRDLVIGIDLATSDGKLTKAGGQVVKNVAGYDLSKLVAGSFGRLAAIVSVTFKLSPLSAASKTLVLTPPGRRELIAAVEAISASQLEPVALDIQARRSPDVQGSARCLVRFAAVAAAVDTQIDEAIRLAAPSGAQVEILERDAESRLWRAHSLDRIGSGEAVVRLSWLPADLERLLSLVDELGAAVPVEACGRAAVGAGWLRVGGPVNRQAAAVERLRQSPAVGNVVVMHAASEVKALVDVWGPRQNAELIDAIARAMDPHGTLNTGRA